MCPISSAVTISAVLCPTLPEGTGAEGPCSISSLSVVMVLSILQGREQGCLPTHHQGAMRCLYFVVIFNTGKSRLPVLILHMCWSSWRAEWLLQQLEECSPSVPTAHLVLYELQESRGRWSRIVPGLDKSVPLASKHILDLQSYSFNSSWVLIRTTPSKHFCIAYNSQALSLLWEHPNIPVLGLSVECIHSLLTNTISQMKLKCSRKAKVTYVAPQTQSKCPTPSVQQHGDMVLLATVLISTVKF